jgi:hypothetical protein
VPASLLGISDKLVELAGKTISKKRPPSDEELNDGLWIKNISGRHSFQDLFFIYFIQETTPSIPKGYERQKKPATGPRPVCYYIRNPPPSMVHVS